MTVTRGTGDPSLIVKNGAILTFTAANWNTWQPVTLAASDDADAANGMATFQIGIPGWMPQVFAATELDDDIGENVALASGGATISGGRVSDAAKMIDGVHNLRSNYGWIAEPGAATLDLKDVLTVSRVRVLNWDGEYRLQSYKIETSLDGTTWSILADASVENRSGWDDWAVKNPLIRYLRLTGLSNAANPHVVFSELEVYGTRPPVLPQPELWRNTANVREAGEGRFYVRMSSAVASNVVVGVSRISGDTNLVVKDGATLVFRPLNWSGWQVVTLGANADDNSGNETATFQVSMPGAAPVVLTATALDDDIGVNMALSSGGAAITGTKANQLMQVIDGVHTSNANYGWTVWTNDPGTITLDLRGTTVVSRIRLLNWDWSYRVHRYKIESSLNGTSWSILADASGADRHGWDDWAVAGQVMRYLRFTGLSNSANQCVAVSELEVYGTRESLPQPELWRNTANVREAGQGRFYVRMSNAVLGNVVVTASRSGGDSTLAVTSGATLTFTPANWNTWQAVTLAATDDANSIDETATFHVATPGATPVELTATALDDDIGENLALASGGATISGGRASDAAKMIDGVHTVRSNYGWIAEPGTVTLDLKAATVSRVRVLNWDGDFRLQSYKIESSLDGTTWSILADASRDNRNGWDDWTVTNSSIRYVRFTGLSNAANPYVIFSELEVYGTRPAAKRSLTPLAKTVSIALPVTVVTSDDGPEHTNGWAAVDGDPETAWVGQRPGGGYIVLGYGSTVTLSSLEVDMAEGSLTNIAYLYSLDAKEWIPLPDDVENNPVELNYLWLVFPDEGVQAVPQVLEIRPKP